MHAGLGLERHDFSSLRVLLLYHRHPFTDIYVGLYLMYSPLLHHVHVQVIGDYWQRRYGACGHAAHPCIAILATMRKKTTRPLVEPCLCWSTLPYRWAWCPICPVMFNTHMVMM
jgi:hypothetical protein